MKKMTLLTVVFVFTFSINAQTAIQEFDFNGTFSNAKNDVSFTNNATFVNDRTGAPNRAIRINNSYIEATVLDLPFGNSSRTVSVWVKYNDLAKTNYLWGYGSSIYNARYFGLIQGNTVTSVSDLNLAGCGEKNDAIVSTTVDLNIWYNYTVTYDGFTSKIYRNGELIKSAVSPRKLTSGIILSIGKMGGDVSINADIDDLKIFDVALSETEVIALFKANPSLTLKSIVTANTSKKVDAKAVTKVPLEEGGIKTSEIFSTKGIKVFAGNTNMIDISSILDGTYLLQISYIAESPIDKKTTESTSKIRNEKIVLNVPVIEEKVKYFEIYSTKGTKIFAGDSNGIDISSIPQGAYSLKIINKTQSPIDKTISSY